MNTKYLDFECDLSFKYRLQCYNQCNSTAEIAGNYHEEKAEVLTKKNPLWDLANGEVRRVTE